MKRKLHAARPARHLNLILHVSAASDTPRDDPAWSAPDSPPVRELRTLALERAVRWEPADDITSSLQKPLGTVSAIEPLVVHQRALTDIETHAAASRAFAFGVLYGEIYRCPRLRIDYVLVEGAQRGDIDDAPPDADLRSTLAALIDRLRASGVRAVGWYRTGTPGALHLSSEEVSMHAALFPEPWAVAFVRDALIVRSAAAFVRLANHTRPYAVPFFEQLAADAYAEGERPRTAIAWSSYHTMTDVLALELADAPLPLFDAGKIRRAPAARPGITTRPQAARAKPFEPVRAVPVTPAPPPEVQPTPPEAVEPDPPEPAPYSIDRIFDPLPEAATPHVPESSPRRRLSRQFSFRPRDRILALTIAAIAFAILAAWYFTH